MLTPSPHGIWQGLCQSPDDALVGHSLLILLTGSTPLCTCHLPTRPHPLLHAWDLPIPAPCLAMSTAGVGAGSSQPSKTHLSVLEQHVDQSIDRQSIIRSGALILSADIIIPACAAQPLGQQNREQQQEVPSRGTTALCIPSPQPPLSPDAPPVPLPSLTIDSAGKIDGVPRFPGEGTHAGLAIHLPPALCASLLRGGGPLAGCTYAGSDSGIAPQPVCAWHDVFAATCPEGACREPSGSGAWFAAREASRPACAEDASNAVIIAPDGTPTAVVPVTVGDYVAVSGGGVMDCVVGADGAVEAGEGALVESCKVLGGGIKAGDRSLIRGVHCGGGLQIGDDTAFFQVILPIHLPLIR